MTQHQKVAEQNGKIVTSRSDPNVAPLVSVCMLTYNHSGFIKQALDSVLMQETDFRFEVLINDDCSTDGTTAIVREYATAHPEYIRAFFHGVNQFSQGKKALPELFRQSRGKYIALLEGDDAWADTQKLAQQVAFLESTPGCVLCYGNVSKVDEHGHVLEERRVRPPESGRLSQKEMVRCRQLIPTSTVVFRPPLDLDQWIDNVNLVLNGDSFLFAMLAQYGEAGYLGFSPSLYRQHAGGIYSSLDADQRCRRRILTFKVLHDCIDSAYRPYIADSIVETYRSRSKHLRQQRQHCGLLCNAISLLCFSARRRPISEFGSDLIDCMRQIWKSTRRPLSSVREAATPTAPVSLSGNGASSQTNTSPHPRRSGS